MLPAIKPGSLYPRNRFATGGAWVSRLEGGRVHFSRTNAIGTVVRQDVMSLRQFAETFNTSSPVQEWQPGQ